LDLRPEHSMPKRGVFAQNHSQKHPPTEETLTRRTRPTAHNAYYCTLAHAP
jgi:hypothetical protein